MKHKKSWKKSHKKNTHTRTYNYTQKCMHTCTPCSLRIRTWKNIPLTRSNFRVYDKTAGDLIHDVTSRHCTSLLQGDHLLTHVSSVHMKQHKEVNLSTQEKQTNKKILRREQEIKNVNRVLDLTPGSLPYPPKNLQANPAGAKTIDFWLWQLYLEN